MNALASDAETAQKHSPFGTTASPPLPRWKAALLLWVCAFVAEQSLVLLEYALPVAKGPHPGHNIGVGLSELIALFGASVLASSAQQKPSAEGWSVYTGGRRQKQGLCGCSACCQLALRHWSRWVLGS